MGKTFGASKTVLTVKVLPDKGQILEGSDEKNVLLKKVKLKNT